MEYRRAYWDEHVDEDMVRRHEAEIFPLMRKRHLFSGAANFALYDFRTADGWVDENVFAYSNRAGDERAVVLYNNAFNSSKGWIQTSTAINVGSGDSPHLVRKSVSEALGLKTGEGDLYIFRDYRTHLQYLRSGQQIAADGLYAELSGYQCQAFLDWQELFDHDGSWRMLMHKLNGAGAHNIEDVHRELQLEPVLGPLRSVLTPANLAAAEENAAEGKFAPIPGSDGIANAVRNFLGGAVIAMGKSDEPAASPQPKKHKPEAPTSAASKLNKSEWDDFINADKIAVPVAIARLLHEVCCLKRADDQREYYAVAFDRIESWHLRKTIAPILAEFYRDEYRGYLDSVLIATLITSENLVESNEQIPDWYFDNPYLKRLLAVNTHKGIEWFSKDGWERLIRAYAALTQFNLNELATGAKDDWAKCFDRAMTLISLGEESEYQFLRLKKALSIEPAVSGDSIR